LFAVLHTFASGEGDSFVRYPGGYVVKNDFSSERLARSSGPAYQPIVGWHIQC
jgi:hypothetical protein